jgi:alkyldihydroxyacetonephosphate synthase
MSKQAKAAARRLGGWGFEGQGFEPPAPMLSWLRARFDNSPPFPKFDAAEFEAPPAPELPELPGETSQDGLDRLAHARGQALADMLRLRSGTVRHLPAAVVRPGSEEELEALLAAASREGLRLVPWGGGTSVTGGVNLVDAAPAVSVDLGRLSGLHEIDTRSGLATFGAGTFGPALEAALEPHGFSLGHFPQSFECSTLGGWIAAHSSGQESLGTGRIADLVAGLRVFTPAGRLEIPSLPASASGPDLRRLMAGSEGRFGIFSRATMRVAPLPADHRVQAVLLPGFLAGVEAARLLVKEEIGLCLLRLSDETETEVAISVGLARRRFAGLSQAYLRLRGIGDGAALLLLGSRGEPWQIERCFEAARTLLRPYGAHWLGEGTGRHWRRDRFRHPYLRDGLLDHGIACDTFETATTWSGFEKLYGAVREALRAGASGGERELPVLCHLSHPYKDGASLYFTFFFRVPPDGDAAIARWADLKRRASWAIAAGGGAISHHHGIGTWHSPWLRAEIGDTGAAVLEAVARQLDPHGILCPPVLLDPTDRLEA